MGAHIREWTGKDGRTRYQVRWSHYEDGKRIDGKETVYSKAQARQVRNAKEAEILGTGRANPAAPGKETLAVWAERWYASRLTTKKPTTLRGDRQILDQTVIPLLGNRPIRTITPGDVDDFIMAVREPPDTPSRSAKTVRHHYGVLRQVLKYAARRKAITLNPAIGAEIPKDAHDHTPFVPLALGVGEVAALAAAMEELNPGTPYGLLVEFMAYTGLRTAEVSGLRICDLDLVHGRIFVTRTLHKHKCTAHPDPCDDGACCWTVTSPKNRKPRVVDVPTEWLLDDLRTYVADHPNRATDNAPLWPGRKRNDPRRITERARGGLDWNRPWWRDGFYQRHFKPAVVKASLPAALRLHDLRHTAGSLMIASGARDVEAAEQLGHSLHVFRTIYAHEIGHDPAATRARYGSTRPAPSQPVATVTNLHAS